MRTLKFSKPGERECRSTPDVCWIDHADR
jgi:hypothetical protein